ncbi:MAG TPA: NnrU family protein, partial [Rhizobiales bacterium]|nr:NnrU family protein [Hyphomicrobiales bacterium]
ALMLPACLILALAIGRPNPFSFGGARNDRFDPQRPGIVRFTRHPLLAALTLWSAAHVLPNGDLAHVLVFGALAAFALFGGRLVDRRRQREMGPAWADLRRAVASSPVAAIPDGETLARLAAGPLLYAALIPIHQLVIGVDPLG